MPVAILVVQGAIVTLFSLLFIAMPSINSSYWILVALASELYMIMYILMFITAIRLRYIKPEVVRTYRVSKGLAGLWVISCLGIFGCLFAIIIGLFPPAQVDTGNLILYESVLIGGILIFCLLPILIFNARKPEWKKPI